MSARWVGYPPPHIDATRALTGPFMPVRGGRVRIPHSLPLNTLDPRYLKCTDHHPACDCREAHLAENAHEAKMHIREVKEELAHRIRGHATIVNQQDGQRRNDLECQCPLCDYARAADLVPQSWSQPEGQGNFRTVANSSWNQR